MQAGRTALGVLVVSVGVLGAGNANAQTEPAGIGFRAHAPVGLYGFGNMSGFSWGVATSLTKGRLRAEASYELLTNIIGSGRTTGVRVGWTAAAGRRSRATLPVLVGWRFADMDNDCRDAVCQRTALHALSLDAAVAVPMGHHAEIRVGITYGFPLLSVVWEDNAGGGKRSYFHGAHLVGFTISLGLGSRG